MKGKEFLKRIRTLEIQIGYKKEQLEAMELLIESPRGVSYGERMSGSGDVHSGESLIVKFMDLKDAYEKDVERLVTMKAESMKTLDKVTDEYPEGGEVLYKRYYQRKNWKTIADEMSYSLAQIYRIHGRALQLVDKYIARDAESPFWRKFEREKR